MQIYYRDIFRKIDIHADPGEDLRHHHDTRYTIEKGYDLMMSLFREAQCFYNVFLHRSNDDHLQWHHTIQWQQNSRGLVVMIPGINTNPKAWFAQMSELSSTPEIDTYAPDVSHRGFCSLKTAARPILAGIREYTLLNPRKPICLLGISNGTRIATWIETRLRATDPRTPVFVSSIAGVHRGSSRFNLLERLHLSQFVQAALRCNLSKQLNEQLRKISNVVRELRYDSDRSQELLERVREPLNGRCAPRSYEFYATTEDPLVDLDSSLPPLGQNNDARYYLLHGEGHCSIITKVAKRQIRHCLAWINSF